MKTAVGVDIGGTFVKAGLIRGGSILRQDSFSTSLCSTPRQLIGRIAAAVSSLASGSSHRVSAVGVGVPGFVESRKGVVRSAVNLCGNWKSVPLGALLRQRVHLPVFVDNDANLMALAEWRQGAGRGTNNLFCVTLGTGVGGGMVLNGAVYRGRCGSAGEIGHVPVSPEGPRCNCGGRGCLERFVGNQAIVGWVKKELAAGRRSIIPELVEGDLKRLSPEVVDQAARRKDALARETWDRVGSFLGVALAGVVNLLSPERIVVGGGVANAGKFLFDPVAKTLRQRMMKGLPDVPVVPARLGACAGMIGAALLIQETERGD